MRNFKIATDFVLAMTMLFLFANPVNAQLDSLGVALPTEVISENVESGHIVCLRSGGVVLCDLEYDASMFGVVSDTPALSFRHDDDQNLPLVLENGNTLVQVTSRNGNIEVGDLITSSETPGIGQKATLNGYVLGIALESYESEDPDAVGNIYTSLSIHPVADFAASRSNIISSLRQALSAPTISPLASFRYLLAFLIALISFALGFFYFGRVISSGVEAIGRNPLAKRTIQITVLVNIVITLGIVLTGLGIALLILII